MGNGQRAIGAVKDVRETKVYRLGFAQAMDIFDITKKFPKEEIYSLTDQVRRSSRSVCICLLEAYRKKRYPAHFVSKVPDSDMENSETLGLTFLLPVIIFLKKIMKHLLQEKTKLEDY